MEQQPRKAEALMREQAGRLTRLYDGATLAEWVTQIQNPALKGAAAQRIIEADIFNNAPMKAMD